MSDAYPTAWPHIVLRCANPHCRIQTYVGNRVHPLRNCPICAGAGVETPEADR